MCGPLGLLIEAGPLVEVEICFVAIKFRTEHSLKLLEKRSQVA